MEHEKELEVGGVVLVELRGLLLRLNVKGLSKGIFPNLEILSQEAIEIIEYNAETVLEEIGVAFTDNPGAIEIWRNAGADIEGERVRIPRGLARKLCRTAPKKIHSTR